MKGWIRVVALVLGMAGMTSSLAAQVSSAQSPHEKPAGCHQHGNKLPERVPTDYRCCVAGHASAMVRPSCVSQPEWQRTFVLPFATPLPAEFWTGLIPEEPIPLTTTSSFAPLRI
jgi:hypothetical protein